MVKCHSPNLRGMGLQRHFKVEVKKLGVVGFSSKTAQDDECLGYELQDTWEHCSVQLKISRFGGSFLPIQVWELPP